MQEIIRVDDQTLVVWQHVAVVRVKREQPHGKPEVQLLGPSGQCLAVAREEHAVRLIRGLFVKGKTT